MRRDIEIVSVLDMLTERAYNNLKAGTSNARTIIFEMLEGTQQSYLEAADEDYGIARLVLDKKQPYWEQQIPRQEPFFAYKMQISVGQPLALWLLRAEQKGSGQNHKLMSIDQGIPYHSISKSIESLLNNYETQRVWQALEQARNLINETEIPQ